MNRLPAALMSLAIWLLPPGRKEWGEAMQGEFEAMPTGHGQFAMGCLRASASQNFVTLQGWVRLGFLVMAGILLKDIAYHIRSAGFYITSGWPFWESVSYVISCIAATTIATATIFIFYKASTKPSNIGEISDLGAKIIILYLASIISEALFAVLNGIAQSLRDNPIADWQGLIDILPITVVFTVVGILGWGNAKKLHLSALFGLFAIVVANLSDVSIFIQPSKSVLAPLADFLRLESLIIQGEVWLQEPLLGPLTMGIIWAFSFMLSIVNYWLGEKSPLLRQ